MRVTFLILVLVILTEWGTTQFLNNRPFPTYSLESMPDTGFTCRDKILGGYYADPETQCQMFHVCVKVAGIGVQDFRFLCPNGTAFDQDHQICADWDDVDCDATTLYYSSDNFDLYRLGSGFESKAVKYGEEEETFALQRAETGDARLNREHQAQRVNQQKQYQNTALSRNQQQQQNKFNNNYNSEKDIFKVSSSSNFFNNRNSGKELDEDVDDGNVNVNQNRDNIQKKKIIRKQHRRPQQQPTTSQQPTSQQSTSSQQPTQTTSNIQENHTRRPHRPTGFINNFAGSSFVPTTQAPVSVTEAAPPRQRNSHRRISTQPQFTNTDNLNTKNQQSTQYTISTPAPFRQTQQYQVANNGQPSIQTKATSTENYPSNFPQKIQKPTPSVSAQAQTFKVQKQTAQQNYPTTPIELTSRPHEFHYDVPKIKPTKHSETTPFKQTQSAKDLRNDNYPTTFAPKIKYDFKQGSQKTFDNLPTTFAPRSNPTYNQNVNLNRQQQSFNNNQQQLSSPPNNNPQYTELKRQPQNYNQQAQTTNQGLNNGGSVTNAILQYNDNNNYQQPHAQPFAKQFNGQIQQNQQQQQQQQQQQVNNQNVASTNKFSSPQFNNNQSPTTQFNGGQTTQRTTPFTQYTPTVPKVTSTTPVSRSNRFDETQYDDGSYSSKYDNYDNSGSANFKDDEFLKTAHSQNIASSRNEYIKNAQKQSLAPVAATTTKPFYNESPRPFSASPNTPKVTDYPKTTKTTQAQLVKQSTIKQQQQKQTVQPQQQQYQQPAQQQVHQQKPQQQQQIYQQKPEQQQQQQQHQQKPQQQQQIHKQKPQQPQPPQQPQQQQQPKQQPQQQQQNVAPQPLPKKKDYDYAYYDSIADDQYDNLDAEIQKDFSKTP